MTEIELRQMIWYLKESILQTQKTQSALEYKIKEMTYPKEGGHFWDHRENEWVPESLIPCVLFYLSRGKKIAAIIQYKSQRSCSLADAKLDVEEIARQHNL